MTSWLVPQAIKDVHSWLCLWQGATSFADFARRPKYDLWVRNLPAGNHTSYVGF
jgi:hypothetical protein